MPRSSKHKSSKHGAREHSDSETEKDSGRKGKGESAATKASRDSGEREKRRKDGTEYSDEYGSSKRRKERRGSNVGERGNGSDEERGEGSKKASKARRRDEKERREGAAAEKERKVREGRRERWFDNEELRVPKQRCENNDSRNLYELRSPELDNQLERRMRKNRDSGDGDKHQGDVEDVYDRRLSSRGEITRDARQKDEKRKDGKYRDKYREEKDRENKHRHDKQRDEDPAKDHTSINSDDKHAREEEDSLESQQKRIKLPESDCDREHEHERYNDRVYDSDYGLDYDRDRDWDWDQDHNHLRDRDHDHDRGHYHDRDRSHADDRSATCKESGTKKRTLEDHDDYTDTKSRVIKRQYPDAGKGSLSSSRADSDVDRGRSQSRQAYTDPTGTCNKHGSSPASNTHISKDEYRNANSEDPIYRDAVIEQKTKGSREVYSVISERGHKYKSMEKSIKIDDGPVGDLSTERSSTTKAASMGVMERSPSTTTERRYMNRSDIWRSLEIEESGRRNIIDAGDFSTSDDRLGWELALDKPLLGKPPQAESSFYVRTSQGNASLVAPPPALRAALDRPFIGGCVEDDVRDNSSTRYRRSSDPGFGRGHGNSWRAVPNWTSPVPNGFVSFQPGPTHGGFQTMIPQFTGQPLFGVRPSMDVNHAGISYHVADADRFPGHLRPIRWQSAMDDTASAHLHGWESNTGVFRGDPHMYGGSDWDRSKHSTNSRGWESGLETWKKQNGDSKKDLPSPACKDESGPAQEDDVLTDNAIQISRDDEHNKDDDFHEKSPETKSSSLSSSAKVPLKYLSTAVLEKVPDSLTPSDNTYPFSRFYLSKLDISADLVIPELYDQCMCVVNFDNNGPFGADFSAKLFQKNGSRGPKKYAATFSRHLLFPAIDNSIFQRAIDLYKKQRVKLPNGGKVDILSAYDQVQVDESAPIHNLENQQVSASASDGIEDVPILEQKKLETLSPAKENLQEIDHICSQTEQDHDCTHSLKSSPSSGDEKQRQPVVGLSEKEDEDTSDKVNLGEAEENNPMAFKNECQLAPTLHDDDNVQSKTIITTGFAHRADEKLGFGDNMISPLIFGDGSPRACDALMPGSIESQSLILSRIHHSTESTH